ncbi:MAG: BatA domain-containing protein [Planctomycetaceae bacterium]
MPPMPFAFGFASPWLLWGLALGTAPVIIHLLNRRRYKETSWAAMRFLLEAVRKNSRRLRIEQLVLLAVRAGLLVLLALALAQPTFEQLGAFFQPSQPVHRLIVIDASLSMGFQPREQSLFDRARDIARRIVTAGKPGDAFNLARLSNIPPAVVVSTPAYQEAKLLEEIDQMQLPQGRADLLASLTKAALLLEAAPDLPRKEVYILTDLQRASWTPESADDAARLKTLMKQLDAAGRLVLVDVGQADAGNAAVARLDAAEPFVTAGRSVQYRAALHNYGTERVSGRTVEFLVDERVVEQRSVEISAGAEVIESFVHVFAAGGEHRVQVRLQRDHLPLDDQRWLAAPVKDRLRVLCVNGGAGAPRASDFLELALAPIVSAKPVGAIPEAFGKRLAMPGGPTAAPASRPMRLVEPHVVSEGELQGVDLSLYDCVFLCDVRMFTDREARLLETYLGGGGGVVWCLGPQAQVENYNQTLYRDGAGPLPARLEELCGGADQRRDAFAFDPGEFGHPLIGVFDGNPGAGLETTQTYTYRHASLAQGGPARVALKFDSGDPAIIEAPFGRGKGILITTSIDDAWGLWPLWPSFVPLVHEIVQFAVAGRWGERQRQVGEALSGVFPAEAIDVEVSVVRPDGMVRPAHVTPGDDFSEFRYDGTAHAGVYAVELASPVGRTELFAVNVDPRESNLARFSQDELSLELLQGVDYEYDTNWQEPQAVPASAPTGPRGGLTRWLLYAVLYLLFVEQLMAWDFRLGLCLLCPPLVVYLLLTAGRNAPPTLQN